MCTDALGVAVSLLYLCLHVPVFSSESRSHHDDGADEEGQYGQHGVDLGQDIRQDVGEHARNHGDYEHEVDREILEFYVVLRLVPLEQLGQRGVSEGLHVFPWARSSDDGFQPRQSMLPGKAAVMKMLIFCPLGQNAMSPGMEASCHPSRAVVSPQCLHEYSVKPQLVAMFDCFSFRTKEWLPLSVGSSIRMMPAMIGRAPKAPKTPGRMFARM